MAEHGDLQPEGHLPVDPLGRNNHSTEGFSAVLDETARLAIVQIPPDVGPPLTVGDRGRVVYQTAGIQPGHYMANGLGGWAFLGDDSVALTTTTAPINLWVRDDTGNDTNDGTLANPLKTVLEAVSRIPFGILHTVIIHVGKGTYVPPEIERKSFGERFVIVGDGAGLADGGFDELPGLGTLAVPLNATSGTVNSITDTSLTETPDDTALLGRTIIIDSGTGVGQRRQVSGNTADTFETDVRFVPAPDATSKFRVVTCNVLLEIPTENHKFLAGSGPLDPLGDGGGNAPCLFLAQMRFTYDGLLSFPAVTFADAQVALYGIENDTSAVFGCQISALSGCTMLMGTGGISSNMPLDLGLAGVVDDKSWEGWGVADLNKSDATFWAPLASDAKLDGYMVTGFLSLFDGKTQAAGEFYGSPFGFGGVVAGFNRAFFQQKNSDLDVGTRTRIVGTGSLHGIFARDRSFMPFVGESTDIQVVDGAAMRAMLGGQIGDGDAFGLSGAKQPTGGSSNGPACDSSLGGTIVHGSEPVLTGGGAFAAKPYVSDGVDAAASEFSAAGAGIQGLTGGVQYRVLP